MNDELLEAALRDWFRARPALDAPASLRRHLDALSAPAGPAMSHERIVLRPVRRVATPPRAMAPRRFGAIAAAVVVVLVGGGLWYGLTLRPNPVVSGSPTPGATVVPEGSASPGASSTAVVDAGLVDSKDGWALTAQGVWWTADGGRSWRSITPPDVAPPTIRAVRFVDARFGWLAWWSAAEARVTIERTDDGGLSWSRSHTPGTHPGGVGAVFIDALDDGSLFVEIAANDSGSGSTCRGELDASRDAGISWLSDVRLAGDAPGLGCRPIAFLDPAHGWTTAGPGDETLVATTDGGRSWTTAQPLDPGSLGQNLPSYQAPVFTDDGQGPFGILPVRLQPPADPGIATRSGQVTILRTGDGGATWEPRAGPPDPMLSLEGPIAASPLDSAVWLVGGSSTGPRLWRTEDAGGSWREVAASGLGAPIAALRFADRTSGWAIDRAGALHATVDAGTSWRSLSPTAPAGPTTVPSSPPTTGAAPFTWTLVSSEGDLATYGIAQVIPRRNGGAIGVAFGQEARTVHSDDGTSWVLDPADPGLLDTTAGHLDVVDGIADGPAGLVAVGASALDDFSTGDARAWTSGDGRAWQPATRVGGGTDAEMKAVVGGKGGYVAVGSDGFPGMNVQLPGAHGAAAWTSADGQTWVRAPDQPAFSGAIMTGVALTSTGYVAWGEIAPMSQIPNQPLPVWTSPDGVHWDRTTSGRGQRSFVPIGRVLDLAERMVAVGTRDVPDAAGGGSRAGFWTSDDGGRTWASAALDDATTATSGSVFDVGLVDSDLIAVGSVDRPVPADDGRTGAAAWRSSDGGQTWSRLPDDPALGSAAMAGILPLDENRFAAFGRASDLNAFVNPSLIWLATRQP